MLPATAKWNQTTENDITCANNVSVEAAAVCFYVCCVFWSNRSGQASTFDRASPLRSLLPPPPFLTWSSAPFPIYNSQRHPPSPHTHTPSGPSTPPYNRPKNMCMFNTSKPQRVAGKVRNIQERLLLCHVQNQINNEQSF